MVKTLNPKPKEELQQEAEFEEALRQLGGSAKLVRCTLAASFYNVGVLRFRV